ncbi:MAG: hypothetical protein K9J79_09700 [Desulfobacteraceae bacterium]|nr:hypothetical protein [Desulfobacteraceae bacterium]
MLNPYNFLLAAVFVSSLRSYGVMAFPVFTLSAFRLLLIFCIILLVIRSLSILKIKIADNTLPVFFLSLINAAMVIMALSYSPHIYLGDSARNALIKCGGWLIIAIICILVNTKNKLLVAVKIYVLSSTIPMILGWYQWIYFLLYKEKVHLPVKVLAIDSPKAMGVIDRIFLRPAGTFLEPNYYGIFLSTVILLLVASLITKHYLFKKSIILVLLASAVLQLGCTLSLSAMIGLISGLFFIFFLLFRNMLKLLSYGIMIFICMLVVSFTIPQGKSLYEGAFYKIERRAEDVSNLFGRKKYFLSAYQAVIESAGMGVGFGGIGQHDPRAPQSGHNAPLNILAEQGIVPFTIFLLWVLWI